MISIDSLRAYGANVDEGLSRCMGMEDFYLQLVGMQLNDPNMDRLSAAVGADDIVGADKVEEAFEAAHALKGALGNLAITPIQKPVEEITERLRGAKEPVDLSDLMPAYRAALEGLREL